MKTFELLDRLEILFPDNTFFADMRKTILSDDQLRGCVSIKLVRILIQTVLVEDN
jgi:hypothetical protein